MHHIHVLSISAQSTRNQTKKVHKMSIQSLWHIHLSLCRTINLCVISEESNSKKVYKCQYNICGIYIYLCSVLSISVQSPRNQTLKSLQNVNTISAAYTSISAPYYQSLRNLRGIKLKKFTKCQYNLCGIYIYLCSILSISVQSPRN